MRVLITGGSGFIGSHVAKELDRRGDVPVVLDRHGTSSSRYESYLGDVRDATAVTETMAHVDAWVHLAAVLGTQETIANPRPSAETNIFGSLNMLEAAAQYHLPGVYIAVGNHWMENTYSITKTTAERLCRMFNNERGTFVNVVRCVNAYGPGQTAAAPFGPSRVRKIIPSFACRALSGFAIEVYGDGEQVSDMVYVEDVAKVLVDALELAKAGKVVAHVLEAGPSEHHTVFQIAELVRDEAERYTRQKVRINHLPMRPGEVPGDKVTADPSTLTAAGIGRVLVPVEEGMRRTVEWFWRNKGETWNAPES